MSESWSVFVGPKPWVSSHVLFCLCLSRSKHFFFAKVEGGELVAPIALSAVAEEPCWRASAHYSATVCLPFVEYVGSVGKT